MNGLTEVERTERTRRQDSEWSFRKGDVREAFQKVFSPDANYALFQTIANQKAVEILNQQRISNKYKKRLEFSNSLMDSYEQAIDEIANKNAGENNFSYYPMICTDGVHNLDRDPNAIFWPRIYIVNEKKQVELKRIINELAGDEAFEVLKKHESPQFYQMAEIEILHEQKIAPIVRLERELKIGAQELVKYIDFLAQMRETCKLSSTWTSDD